jgi:hypothetical protein
MNSLCFATTPEGSVGFAALLDACRSPMRNFDMSAMRSKLVQRGAGLKTQSWWKLEPLSLQRLGDCFALLCIALLCFAWQHHWMHPALKVQMKQALQHYSMRPLHILPDALAFPLRCFDSYLHCFAIFYIILHCFALLCFASIAWFS